MCVRLPRWLAREFHIRFDLRRAFLRPAFFLPAFFVARFFLAIGMTSLKEKRVGDARGLVAERPPSLKFLPISE